MPGPAYRRLGAPAAAFAFLLAAAPAGPAGGWTAKTQQVIAEEAARLAPPDLWRQLDRHRRALREGAVEPFGDRDPARHVANPDGSGRLERVIAEEVARAVRAIEDHRPFEEVVRQLGVVSHYVADAANPLNTAEADAQEGRYFADFARYLESAEPRLPVVFYGVNPLLEASPDPAPLVAEALRRGRALYPLVGREYRRIGFGSGTAAFDDRSTAFGVASLAFSHAVSEAGLAFRHVWLRAGGADSRGLPKDGEVVLRLPRAQEAR
jgi:hypothetical protein